MTKISVIIPTYNREKYVKKCLDSILNQTLKDIEIIIVDDGSQDNTKEIVNSYKDKRIKYIYKNNTGIGDTRNKGISLSKGEYISFVDIDDYIDELMLEKMYKKAKKDDLDIVICNYIEINEKTKQEKKYNLLSFENTSLKKLPNIINKTNLGPCNKIFKKELFNELLFPTNIKYEDMALVIKLYKKAKKIGKIDEYLSYFTIHEKSETTIRDELVFDIFKSLDIIRNTLNENIYQEELETLIISKLTNYNIQQKYQEDKKIAKKFINDSFNYLNKYYPNYKNNKYFKERKLKGIIEKSKFLTEIYCLIWR